MITLYNSLTRKKEAFKPLRATMATMYTCGPTVYQYAHIGNLRSFIFADLLKRTLLSHGLPVRHIMNITDVGHLTDDADAGDDKVEKSARREGKTAREIAAFYTRAFKADARALNIIPPERYTKATAHIREQIALIAALESGGHTYRTRDGIYFDTKTFPAYGALLGKNALIGLRAGARVSRGAKKNPTDFALWKFSRPPGRRQMEWSSPWGVGFPGWHIECSAMSMKYLGQTLDIHTGGIDHIPVHHTNEIAQSEAATGKSFVRFWLHGEFLVMRKIKMAKSAGNFLTLRDLTRAGYHPMAFRYLLLQTHYRKPLEFSFDALDAAARALSSLTARCSTLPSGGTNALWEQARAAMADDLGAPQALSALWTALKSAAPPSRAAVLRVDKLLGLNLAALIAAYKKKRAAVPAALKKIMSEREAARNAADYAKADALREELERRGWHVDDTPQGPLPYPAGAARARAPKS